MGADESDETVGLHGGPDRLGTDYEIDLPTERRRETGSFYTPRPIAEGLVGFALEGAPPPRSVCDPAVGGGAFLLAAARHLERTGLGRADIVRNRLWGGDRDAKAVEVTRQALRQWSGATGETADPGPHLVVGDTLLDHRLERSSPARGFDLVVGNPPFLSQLDRRTVRTRGQADALRDRFGAVVGAYTDTAALFVLAALDLVAAGGRVALVLPESFLAARDAAGVRDRARDLARVDALWSAGDQVFDASVDVCAPVLVRADDRIAVVRRAVGSSFETVTSLPESCQPANGDRWSTLAAGELGGPAIDLTGDRTLGEMARATAGFRDQYYALSGSVHDAASDDRGDDPVRPKLVTSGLVDPAVCLWGRRSTRFLRRSWSRPRVDLDRLRVEDPKVARWAEGLLVPKVVVATQTRVVEAAVDVAGGWYPSTPTIAVVGSPDQLWAIAAVLLAPATSAWAFRRVAGAALTRDAIKLSASDIAAMPLPADDDAWRSGAARLEAEVGRCSATGERPDLAGFAEAMGRAYRTPAEVEQWWAARLPTRSVTPRSA